MERIFRTDVKKKINIQYNFSVSLEVFEVTRENGFVWLFVSQHESRWIDSGQVFAGGRPNSLHRRTCFALFTRLSTVSIHEFENVEAK